MKEKIKTIIEYGKIIFLFLSCIITSFLSLILLFIYILFGSTISLVGTVIFILYSIIDCMYIIYKLLERNENNDE